MSSFFFHLEFTAIDVLSNIWKSNLSDKIKRIFPRSGRVYSTIWMHHMDIDKLYREKARRKLQKNPGSNISQRSSCMATYL